MISFFALTVVIAVIGSIPALVGLNLSLSDPPPWYHGYKYLLAFLLGALAIYTGTFLYYRLPSADTCSIRIAETFTKAVPYLLWTWSLIFALAVLDWWVLKTVRKRAVHEALHDAEATMRGEMQEGNPGRIETDADSDGLSNEEIEPEETPANNRDGLFAQQGAKEEWEKIQDSWKEIDKVRYEMKEQFLKKKQLYLEDYLRKKQSYLEEIERLKAIGVLDREIIDAQDELIRLQQEGCSDAADRAARKLSGLKRPEGAQDRLADRHLSGI